jgi:hypothetical protein
VIEFGGGKIAHPASMSFYQVMDWLRIPGMKRFWRIGNGSCSRFAEDGKTVIENR